MKSFICRVCRFGFCIIFTLVVLFGLGAAQTTAQNANLPLGKGSKLSPPTLSPQGAAAGQAGKVAIMVELRDPPAALAYAAELKAAQAQLNAKIAADVAAATTPDAANAALQQASKPVQLSTAAIQTVQATVHSLDSVQRQILPSLTGGNIGGQVIYRLQKAYNGIAMYVTADKIPAIAAMPNVKAVHRMVPKYPVAFSDIDFLGARSFWQPSGLNIHGENISVADIDTGLDYVHTNFGGPGTAAAYASVSDKSPVPNPYFPTSKIPGGYDFAGDSYDGTNMPSPDPNPFDGEGHGTGTASLIGGFGVTNTGATYTGSYDNSTPIASFRIAPGFAPEAKIYPLKVFGSTGGTNLVSEAIEYAMDPNGDGNFSDHYDVINMSLGAPDGFVDDPDNVTASNAAAIGIIVVSAAGNDADSYYDVSGPSVSVGTLSVAATYNNQNGFVYTAIATENSPTSRTGFSNFTTTSPTNQSVPSTLVCYAVNPAGPTGDTHDGSSPLTNAAECNGKIVIVDRVPGQGANASVNAQNAGAVGIIDIANFAQANGNPFLLTTSPALHVPMVVCPTAFGNSLVSDAAFDANGHSTTGAKASIAPGNGSVLQPANPPGSPDEAGSPDTIPSYTSRGPRSGDTALKPDLAAPAEVTGVALAFTGNEVTNFNGTSSATPHVSGAMALLRQLHPSWSVQELNALICNTATHDLFTTEPGPSPSPTPPVEYGLGRIGAGRVDLKQASKVNVVAFDQNDNATSVSWGDVEVPVNSSVSIVKNLLVENKGASNAAFNVTYQPVTSVAGASFAIPATVTVNAGGSVNVPITFNANGSSLTHTMDASVSPFDPNFGFDRQWLTEQGGYLVLKQTKGGNNLIRVALYAAPKPVSSSHATAGNFVPTSDKGSFTINLTGAGINTGSNYGGGFDIVSLVKPFELQYASPMVGASVTSNDPNVVKYVGVTSDYATYVNNFPSFKAFTTISFAIDCFGDETSPVFYDVGDRRIYIDVNQDGVDDYVIQLYSIGVGVEGFQQEAVDNLYIPVVFDLNNPANSNFSNYWTNGIDPQEADTNTFNNSAVVVTVDAAQLGLAQGSTGTRFNYHIECFDRNGNLISSTPVMTYDVANPGLEGENSRAVGGTLGVQGQSPFASSPFPTIPAAGPYFEPFFYEDLSSDFIPINYNGTNFRNNGSTGVLLIHMHNGDGNRSDVVLFSKPTISGFTPTHGPVGTKVMITGTNFNSATRVSFNGTAATSVSVMSSTSLAAKVPSGATTGPITVSNPAGSSTSSTNFTIP